MAFDIDVKVSLLPWILAQGLLEELQEMGLKSSQEPSALFFAAHLYKASQQFHRVIDRVQRLIGYRIQDLQV